MISWSVAGNLLLGNELVQGELTLRDGRIVDIRRGRGNGSTIRLEAAIVAPGLIDLQVNGGFGGEVGEDPAAIRLLAERLPATGVTAFLPTLITSPVERYACAFEAFAAARDATGARAIGLHLEGPFLSPLRAGAHCRELIAAADEAVFETILASDALRMMTLAPERNGAHERIRRLRERGVLVSLGHTDASYEEAVAGVNCGATMATHLYNAMAPFGHRAPGLVGAALVDDRVTVGLIVDGVHSHPASLRLAVRAKGPERIVLVSDLMPAAGMPPGRYDFGGQAVQVDGTAARRADGTLAGAIVTLDQAIRNLVRWTEATPIEAIGMATEAPARLLGLADMGRIALGHVADLVLFDNELRVEATIIGGQIAYRRGTS